VTGYDLWTLPLDTSDPDRPKPGKPEPFLRTPADETAPRFSPDGRWIAYRSNESGSDEVYVRPFPGPGGKSQISTAGGLYGIWSKNGHELFYETADSLPVSMMCAWSVARGGGSRGYSASTSPTSKKPTARPRAKR
jgi:Tol biopolymer transport system component